jgi:hypothetical protein
VRVLICFTYFSFYPIPASFARGYKPQRKGNTQLISNSMYAPVHGQYTIFHGNLDEINFNNGWAYFWYKNDIVVGSVVAVRMEMTEDCIGLFMTKIWWISLQAVNKNAFAYS